MADFPDVESKFSEADGVLIVTWPSENPSVSEPLVLKCEIYPSLWWFKGYMFDFPEEVYADESAQTTHLVEFLQGFFAERFACGVEIVDSRVLGGGPLPTVENPKGSWWSAPNCLIRSWHGTYDKGTAT